MAMAVGERAGWAGMEAALNLWKGQAASKLYVRRFYRIMAEVTGVRCG